MEVFIQNLIKYKVHGIVFIIMGLIMILNVVNVYKKSTSVLYDSVRNVIYGIISLIIGILMILDMWG